MNVSKPIAPSRRADLPVLFVLSATHLLNDMIQSLIPAIYPIIKTAYALDFGQIGLITLVGLITKHGILILEFTNQLREEGRELVDALVEAAELRLRPILMTTGAMVLGAVPLALAEGAGAESRSQIGWVIVGGMTFGTLLTLYVVPVAYSYMARTQRPVHGAEPEHPKAHPQPAE